MRAPLCTVAAIVAGVVCLSSDAVAGDLNPPAGPVSPTAKPLSEVEPRLAVSAESTPGDADNVFIITQPGSYYLAGDVDAGIGQNGIFIGSSDVTLDLNGFTLSGQGAGKAVVVDGQSVWIRNGAINGWGEGGIEGSSSPGLRISHINFLRCDEFAVRGGVARENSVIEDCVARECGVGEGINSAAFITQRGVVTRCVAIDCGRGFLSRQGFITTVFTDCRAENCIDGFVTDSDAVYRRCEASAPTGFLARTTARRVVYESCSADNANAGGLITGFETLDDHTIAQFIDCTANTGNGFTLRGRSMLSDCRSLGGIVIEGPGSVVEHTAFFGTMFVPGDDVVIRDCTQRGTGSSQGITVGENALIERTSLSSGRIQAGRGATVIGCELGLQGIRIVCGDDSRVVDSRAQEVRVGSSSLVEGCIAGFGGIIVGDFSTVRDSIVRDAGDVAIRLGGRQAQAIDCIVTNGSGTGILVVEEGARVEGCYLGQTPTGVALIENALGTVVIGNRFSNLVTNIDEQANVGIHAIGPFVGLAGIASATNPFANIAIP